MEGAGVEECDADEEEERGVESDEVGVSVDDVLRVLGHGDDHVSSRLNRFQTNHRSRDELREVEYNKLCSKTKRSQHPNFTLLRLNHFNEKYKKIGSIFI